MKPMPILLAIVVTGALYLVVMDRDTLWAALGMTPDPAVEAPIEDAATLARDIGAPGAVAVVAQRSGAQVIDNAVVLRGRTEADRTVTVAAETSGRIVSEPLRKGAFVEAGDALCILDPGTREASLTEARARLAEAEGRVPEAESAVAEAQARIREAEIEVNAARQLAEGGYASETRLVSAEAAEEAAQAGLSRARATVSSAGAGIEAAEAMVAVAEREIERLTIHAPFAGLLETDTAELGALLQPGAACATIVQLDPVKLVGFVPEIDVDDVEIGAPAMARLASGTQVQGRVTFLSRSADETTRTFRVEVTVPNADLSIRDGQTADILVEAEGQSAHLLPQSSLTLDDDGVLGIRTVDDGDTVLFRPVTLLRDTVDGVWVTGLPDRVDVITVGQEYVVDGVRVDPTYANDADPDAATSPGAAVAPPGPATDEVIQ